MSSNFLKDRGPAKYFHGRKEIIDTFNGALELFREDKDGTTFLIQGAPGAGKTALLDVLSKHAKKNGWKPILINTNTLWSPDELLRRLDKSGRQITSFGAEAGVDHVGHGSFNINIKTAAHTISDILRGQKKPLLLILDEAQTLGMPDVVPSEMKGVTTSILKEIHNGDLGRSIMLLAGGLGTTESGFRTFGISRFMRKCKVPLGCLSHESTCAIIRDFLIHEGGVSKPPIEWIETIAERTNGWPQHIISYADPAVKYLASKQTPTDEGLDMVLQQGREEQIEYYDQRAHDIDEDLRQAFARAVMDVPTDGTTTKPAITSSLKQNGLTQKEADDLFTQALYQGVIDQRKGGRYGIPIPSLHAWLVDGYAKD
ncbi:MAG: ATP-binding protein [Bacteroidetes bacterium]|nr:ATP-binding protein [Bacteroidota bacterium]